MSESGAPLVVRAALVADAPSIAAIGSVAFPAVHNDVVGAEFAAAVVEQTYSLEALTACIARCTAADDAEFLVAERDGEVIGYLHYDSEGAEPELHRIYVDPDKKRGGVGRALMQELHARLKPGAQYGPQHYSAAMAIETDAPPPPASALLMRYIANSP